MTLLLVLTVVQVTADSCARFSLCLCAVLTKTSCTCCFTSSHDILASVVHASHVHLSCCCFLVEANAFTQSSSVVMAMIMTHPLSSSVHRGLSSLHSRAAADCSSQQSFSSMQHLHFHGLRFTVDRHMLLLLVVSNLLIAAKSFLRMILLLMPLHHRHLFASSCKPSGAHHLASDGIIAPA